MLCARRRGLRPGGSPLILATASLRRFPGQENPRCRTGRSKGPRSVAVRRKGAERAKARRRGAAHRDGGEVGGPGGRWGRLMQGSERCRAWAPCPCSPADPLQTCAFRCHRCVPFVPFIICRDSAPKTRPLLSRAVALRQPLSEGLRGENAEGGRLGWVSQAGWAAGEVDSFHFRSGVRQGSPEKGHTEAGGGQGGLFGRDEPLSQVEVGRGGIGEGWGRTVWPQRRGDGREKGPER